MERGWYDLVVFDAIFFILPIRLMAETSKPLRVILSHFPLVWDFRCGLTTGVPGASPVLVYIILYNSVSQLVLSHYHIRSECYTH